MPIKNGILWQKHNGNEKGTYIIKATGEKFATEEEMKNRKLEYAEKTWRSRHEVSSGPDRIFSSALEEETKALEAFRKRLPKAAIADICKQIHHSFSSKEMLAAAIYSKLKKKFFKGEAVRFSHFGKEWEGTVIEVSEGSGSDSSPSDKENAVKYTIELDIGDGKVIRGIDASKICRKEPLSEKEVMSLILLVAFKKSGGNTAWTLDEPIRKEFGVANKIHSMFLGVKSPPTAKNSEVVDLSSDDSEVEIIVPRRSAGMAPNSAVAKKQQAEFAKQQKEAKKLLDKKKEAAKKEELKAKEKSVDKKKKSSKISQTEPKKKKAEGSTSTGEPPKKKTLPLGAPVKVHQKNLTKFLVTTPGKSSPGFSSLTPKRIGEKKVESTCARLTKELCSGNKQAFYNACAIAAKSLSLPLIESIPNELLRFAVKRQYDQNKDMEAMKNMSAEQKKEYRENVKRERRDGEMVSRLHDVLNKKLDDTLVDDAKPLPNLTPIYDPLDERAKIFPSCLSISEFLYTFRMLLVPEHLPTAEDLVEAVLSGRKGFLGCIGHVIVSLLKTLVQDKARKYCYVYGTRVSDLPITLGTVTYLLRIIIAGGSRQLQEDDQEPAAVNNGEGGSSGAVMERDTETPDSIFNLEENHELLRKKS